VRTIIDESGVDARQICLEITESLAMEDVDLTAIVLTNLHELGVTWAIDDFGTGYSSLSYLKRFPVDVIKVDRSLSTASGSTRPTRPSSPPSSGWPRTLKMMTVAEGVETVAQLRQLRRLGCDFAQGYHLSRPLPASEAEVLLGRSWSAPAPTGPGQLPFGEAVRSDPLAAV